MATRTLIFTECRVIHSGTTRDGKPYTIYQLAATREDHTPIENMKLRSFADMPLRVPIECNVERHESPQYGVSYTVSAVDRAERKALKDQAPVTKAEFDELKLRVEALERMMGLRTE